jgi:hypothetical protein
MTSPWIGGAGLLAVIIAAIGFSPDMPYPGVAVILPVVGTAAMILPTTRNSLLGRVLSKSTLQHLGKVSYSGYLWHWPILIFALTIFPKLDISGKIFCALGALALAIAAHFMIENPIRFNPRLIAKPILSLGLAAVLTLVGVGGATVLQRSVKSSAEYQRFEKIRNDVPFPANPECLDRGVECAFVNLNSPVALILFGDSHAAQWFPPLERIANKQNWRLITLVQAGCPAANIQNIIDPRTGRLNEFCGAWRSAALKRIADLRPAAIVMASASLYGHERRGVTLAQVSASDWQAATKNSLAVVSATTPRVFLIRDIPKPGVDIPMCLAYAERRASHSCETTRSVGLNSLVDAQERAASQSFQVVTRLDLLDWLCDRDTCPPVKQGIVVYRDSDHLTRSFAESLTPVLSDFIVPAVKSVVGGINPEPNEGTGLSGSRLR